MACKLLDPHSRISACVLSRAPYTYRHRQCTQLEATHQQARESNRCRSINGRRTECLKARNQRYRWIVMETLNCTSEASEVFGEPGFRDAGGSSSATGDASPEAI